MNSEPQILNVGGCLLVKSLESEQQDCEFNTLIYRKPVSIGQNWSDVVREHVIRPAAAFCTD